MPDMYPLLHRLIKLDEVEHCIQPNISSLPFIMVADADPSERVRRPSLPWTLLWSTPVGSTVPHSSYTDTLSSRVSTKNNQSRCNLTREHVARGEPPIAASNHTKWTIYTKCVSSRCQASMIQCRCRYKSIACEASGFSVVYVQGVHMMLESAIESPQEPHLSEEMILYADTKLSEDSTIFPLVLFAFICEKVNDGVFCGPPPTQEHVQSYTKRWRAKHRDDTVQPVVEFCAQAMYSSELTEDRTTSDHLIFCDIVEEDGLKVPFVGDGSDSQPMRVGITCYSLLEAYIAVQRISDPSGRYFPIVYYCASQGRADDIAWILAYLKKVLRERYAVTFEPRYVMTDANDAQYNAFVRELPSTTILMCWFHVSQNVKEKIRGFDGVTSKMIFCDLNRLHFCISRDEYQLQKQRTLAAWRSTFNFCPRFKRVSKSLISQWMEHTSSETQETVESRISKWQIFNSPPGYAATNIPLEQCHKTLKIVNKTDRATPIELL
ncbi:MULE transposase domain [Phytophthora cactorum]|nr:MULE transposase domain [Phytophthora cactorum]